MAHSPKQMAADYGRQTLGLLPHGGAAGLSGAGSARPQLDYFRVYVHEGYPDLVFLEAVRVALSGVPLDASLDENWYTVDEEGRTRPFDRFTSLSPLGRATWSAGLVDITTQIR